MIRLRTATEVGRIGADPIHVRRARRQSPRAQGTGSGRPVVGRRGARRDLDWHHIEVV